MMMESAPLTNGILKARESTLLSHAVHLHARYRGTFPAISDSTTGLNYVELDAACDRLAKSLRFAARPGDRVAIAMESSVCYIVAVIAGLRSGLIVCPLNTKLAAPEVSAYAATIEPRLVLADSVNADAAASTGCPVVVISNVHTDLEFGSAAEGVQVSREPEVSLDAPAMLFGTGGTTGVPKAAIYTHRSIWAAIASYSIDGKRSPSTNELTYSPFFHIALMAPLSTLYMGGQLEVVPTVDPAAVLDGLNRGINVIGGTAPTTWVKLRAHQDFEKTDRRSLRSIFLGSAAVAPSLVETLLVDFPDTAIYSGFGSTEHGTVSYATREQLEEGHITGVGRPLPGVQVRVVDSLGHDVSVGEPGELAVTTPWQAVGYWNRPAETVATWTDVGIRIGDVGTVSEDGWITIVGRTKDMIITGGENVFPSEVEPVLLRHSDIAEAAVYGVADDYWGERIEAAIVLRPGTDIDLEQVRDWCRQDIAGYKLPRSLRKVVKLPTTGAHKVDHRRLRQMAEEDPAPKRTDKIGSEVAP